LTTHKAHCYTVLKVAECDYIFEAKRVLNFMLLLLSLLFV